MKDPSESPVELTLSQRRHLELSLGHILVQMEETSDWLERWPLPGDLQDRTRNALEELRGKVLTVAMDLGLSPTRHLPDPRRKMQALTSHWWTTVLDCRSQVLRGYGEVDQATALRLDPLVDDLAASLMELLKLDGAQEERGADV